MKKFVIFLLSCLACLTLIFALNSKPVFASSTLGWHQGHYYFRDGSGEPAVDKVDLIGNYLIDRNGNRHKLNLSKKGNHNKTANQIAGQIAQACKKKSGDTDLKRVDIAAYYVSLFSKRDHYTMHGPYYNKPYGVFIARQYSCAGSTAALRLVLKKMGFKSHFVNKNKFTHQWCSLIMDGRRGFADGQVGYAAYGRHKAGAYIPSSSIMIQKMNNVW